MHGAGDVRFFDRFAPLYDLVMPPAEADALEDALARADRPVERVVDIGGGSGRATLALDVPERIVLDRSAGMLSRARERGLDCVRGDARSLPFADGSVDAVTVVDAFHHMPSQRTVAEEVYRVLAPGGVFAVNEFDPETLLGRGLVVAERVVGFGSSFATPQELTRFLERVGFESAVVETGFEYTVVGKKRENH
ncbi:methyltransferase domain-containing protein [Haloferax mediterranei ATCC 33500]|uniref:Menaquinone biosynthesis methyltransferase UbiE n=1 Tax=Haloferax mediterranei (strain ATCC 33500 / DSM 1411 / JCM 8866 / NBRC 14739 / NCIMB 2177 / R-4) TaxID=523841 RepID=I3R8H9_HALMT|nr:methyltransferase domain-containing protein [Haloferax mediterranei]AFK20539.1 menaquinone biosynthesis methyltransferase UbiE [Haloferax mediterranei ATCC 33500]AHZ23896.1 methyltransferase type 11 [Haloferax mediterranei ATCC 33500]ELZ98321.1 menaquinone biosynthesis methyltransferase UbiE [Haloferax mediterranei ATCC 33500]MDX5986706.1 methyltransferase domain-containing protein [Haloferax mediterranei ATCC 33500]QCQ76663.1 methyltransferase domain-containing protein [Haloferax mediterra